MYPIFGPLVLLFYTSGDAIFATNVMWRVCDVLSERYLCLCTNTTVEINISDYLFKTRLIFKKGRSGWYNII